jgi:hypothetical protein
MTWQEDQRRIRRARKMAKQLGLRISNLRSLDGTGADLWVLAEPRSFDEVEAELLTRMWDRQHFNDNPYIPMSCEVWTDMETIENGDGESVPVQYISVNVCQQCGAVVRERWVHNSWHLWMRSLREWMANHAHFQTSTPTPQERDGPRRSHPDFSEVPSELEEPPRNTDLPSLIERINAHANEPDVLERRSRVREALTTLGPDATAAKLARHLHMDVWEVREHLRALNKKG